VAVGDFNRDGKVDLAVGNTGSVDLSVLAGKGDGTFQPALMLATGYPTSVAVGDFDSDGILDLVVGSPYPSARLAILPGNGDGTFRAAQRFGVGAGPAAVAVGDIDGDGRSGWSSRSWTRRCHRSA